MKIEWAAKRQSGDGEIIILAEINGTKKILSADSFPGLAEEGSPIFQEALERADSDGFAYLDDSFDEKAIEMIEGALTK